jgi:hypothetical protein
VVPVLAVLAGLLLTGCSGGAGRVTASAAPTGTPTADPTAEPSGTSSPAASAETGADFGYFRQVLSRTAPVRLSFDRAIFLSGEAADKAAAERGDETPVPNDFYIVNDNRLLRTLTLSSAVRVTGSIGLNRFAGEQGDAVQPHARTLEDLLGFLGTGQGRGTPFHLVYGEGGVVLSVEEQYLP